MFLMNSHCIFMGKTKFLSCSLKNQPDSHRAIMRPVCEQEVEERCAHFQVSGNNQATGLFALVSESVCNSACLRSVPAIYSAHWPGRQTWQQSGGRSCLMDNFRRTESLPA